MFSVGCRVEHDQAQMGGGGQVLCLQDQVPDDRPDQVPLGAHHGRVLQHDHVLGRSVPAHLEHRAGEVDRNHRASQSEVWMRKYHILCTSAPAS